MSEFAGPLEDSYWVAPKRLLAGPLPASDDRRKLRDMVRALLSNGIRTIIDLRGPSESPAIRSLLYKLESDDDPCAWVGVPIVNGAAPSLVVLNTILDVIDSSLAADRPVYVHCQGGLGRTGTVVAAWWIRHGHYEPEDALEQLKVRRVGLEHGDRPSPETPPQFRLVRSLKPG